jgi:uncharacterized protein
MGLVALNGLAPVAGCLILGCHGLHQHDFRGAKMTLLQRVTREGIAPEVTRPDPAKVLAGDPVHTTWNVEDRDGLYCGLWQSTPGTWRVQYDEWEYMHILQGMSVVTAADGTATTLRAGDSFVIRPGFVGTWQVVETTLKDYVILL